MIAVAIGWYAGQRVFPTPESAGQEKVETLDYEAAKPLVEDRGPERNVADDAEARVGFNRDAWLREGNALAARWPESAEELQRWAFALAAREPLAALTFLDSLRTQNFEDITTWEREIMLDWAQRDHWGMLAGLEAHVDREGLVPDHWFSIAASIVQNEHGDGLRDMLRWMDDMERSGAGNLTLLAMSKLLTHLTPPAVEAITEFAARRADDPAYRDALVQLANAHAHKDPEGALKHIGSFPDAALRCNALLAVVAAVTWDDPVTVINWLNNGELFRSSGLADLSDSEATQLRDEVLTTYFSSVVSAHPAIAAEFSNAISDPASREYVQKMADVMSRTDEVSANDYRVRAPAPDE